MPGELLQNGIYHAPGASPPEHFTIAFLRVRRGETTTSIDNFLENLWHMLQDLEKGQISDLPGVIVPHGELKCLLGYGYNVFDIPGVKKARPAELNEEFRFNSPLLNGGGSLLPNGGIDFASDVSKNPATEDIVIQFTGKTRLSVDRAIVEIQKFISRWKTSSGTPPIELTAAFKGFNRDDHRSWIGFHDGTSNIPSNQRWKIIEIKTQGWTKGGSYLAFIKLSVALEIWESLNRTQQEVVVGRDKITGCPLSNTDVVGNPVISTGCPVTGTNDIFHEKNASFREPAAPAPDDRFIIKSHVQRANNAHSKDYSSRSSLRLYRQGYEFFETLDNGTRFDLGLNFVSFQDTPERLIRMLTQNFWLGKTNFGGEENLSSTATGLDRLLSAKAAGIYLIPPVIDGSYPGSVLFK